MVDQTEDVNSEPADRERAGCTPADEVGGWRDFVLAGYWVETLHDELAAGGER